VKGHMRHPDRLRRTRCGQIIKPYTLVIAYGKPGIVCDCKTCRRLYADDQDSPGRVFRVHRVVDKI